MIFTSDLMFVSTASHYMENEERSKIENEKQIKKDEEQVVMSLLFSSLVTITIL